MSLIFTPLGIRGIFGESFTAMDALRIGNAFGSILGEGSEVVVGMDTRQSSPVILKAVIAGLNSAGVDVINLGVVPTPTIEWAVDYLDADGGVVVSASHNPPEWNALKLLGKRGIIIRPEETEEVRKLYEKGSFYNSSWSSVGKEEHADVIPEYIATIERLVDIESIREAKIRVVLDPNGGAGIFVTPYMMRDLGTELTTINSVPGVFSRELEPRPESLVTLSNVTRSLGASIGFAHDTDADRLTIVTEQGEVMPEDVSLALVVDAILRELKGGTVVVNIASSKMFDDIASRYGARIIKVPVGEVYVAHKMVEVKADVGGEGSCGGVIYPKFHYGRDGPFAAAKILERMAKEGKKISQLISDLPRYYIIRFDIKTKVDWENTKKKLEKIAKERGMMVNDMDGIRMDEESGWFLIRESKTEHKIRVVIEHKNKEEAENLRKEILRIISE
ncbi:MAG: phosphoglucosamine mutase [Candidatus Methanodesulfokora sp.]|jgi:phosphomannomutase/phosphoglucomutase